MSQTTQTNTFDMLSSKTGLSWADEMNELADTDDTGSLPPMPEWEPLQAMGPGDEHCNEEAEVAATSLQNHLESDNICTEHLADDNTESNDEYEQQELSDATTSSSEGPESSSDSSDEDENQDQDELSPSEHVQSAHGSASSSDDEQLGSSEQDEHTSSASGDDDDPTFAPYHPGWTKHLSPSLSPHHSTPPEVNRWAFSPPIGYALQRDLDSVYLDEDCPNLAKPAILSCALLHTDSDVLSGYPFPYGARGLMRPLPKPFRRRRPDFPERSRLSHAEVVEYSQEDLHAIQMNVNAHVKGLTSKAVSEDIRSELPAASIESSPHDSDSGSDTDYQNDLWSPDAEDEEKCSNSSVGQDECAEAGILLAKGRGQSWGSMSEPDLEAYNTFDLDEQEFDHARSIKATCQDQTAYLDLATTWATDRENTREDLHVDELPLPDKAATFHDITIPETETVVLDSTISIQTQHKFSSEYLCSESVSDIEYFASATDDIGGRTFSEDAENEIIDLAIGTALPEDEFVEMHEEKDQQAHLTELQHNIGEESEKKTQKAEERISRYEEASLAVFGGMLAVGRFLWDCLNDRPLVLDNPW